MKKIIYFFTIAFLTTSCATIFSPSDDVIRFDSNPQGATIYINGIELCRTPCSVAVDRELRRTEGVLELEGYEARVFTLTKDLNPVTILNLITPIGFIVDLATGAVVEYDKTYYSFNLEREGKFSALNPHKIEIDTDKKSIDVYVVGEE